MSGPLALTLKSFRRSFQPISGVVILIGDPVSHIIIFIGHAIGHVIEVVFKTVRNRGPNLWFGEEKA